MSSPGQGGQAEVICEALAFAYMRVFGHFPDGVDLLGKEGKVFLLDGSCQRFDRFMPKFRIEVEIEDRSNDLSLIGGWPRAGVSSQFLHDLICSAEYSFLEIRSSGYHRERELGQECVKIFLKNDYGWDNLYEYRVKRPPDLESIVIDVSLDGLSRLFSIPTTKVWENTVKKIVSGFRLTGWVPELMDDDPSKIRVFRSMRSGPWCPFWPVPDEWYEHFFMDPGVDSESVRIVDERYGLKRIEVKVPKWKIDVAKKIQEGASINGFGSKIFEIVLRSVSECYRWMDTQAREAKKELERIQSLGHGNNSDLSRYVLEKHGDPSELPGTNHPVESIPRWQRALWLFWERWFRDRAWSWVAEEGVEAVYLNYMRVGVRFSGSAQTTKLGLYLGNLQSSRCPRNAVRFVCESDLPKKWSDVEVYCLAGEVWGIALLDRSDIESKFPKPLIPNREWLSTVSEDRLLWGRTIKLKKGGVDVCG